LLEKKVDKKKIVKKVELSFIIKTKLKFTLSVLRFIQSKTNKENLCRTKFSKEHNQKVSKTKSIFMEFTWSRILLKILLDLIIKNFLKAQKLHINTVRPNNL